MQAVSVRQKNLLFMGLAIVTVVIALFINRSVSNRVKLLEEERKATACPSLLSIARSSRDTLIVMKNEPLCVSFVLDNLQ